MKLTGVALVHQLVREGRVTPKQAAWLIELRRELKLRRRPWYAKLFDCVFRLFL